MHQAVAIMAAYAPLAYIFDAFFHYINDQHVYPEFKTFALKH